jgi:CBS domain-containing protein
MLTVRDVMTLDVLALAPESSLRDAVELLTARHVTGAPVVSGIEAIGTLSASDILAFESTLPGVPMEREVVDPLLDERVDWDDGSEPPASYFTELWEDAGADVMERFDALDGPEWDVLAEHTVVEAMSHRVIALPPNARLQEAAVYMNEAGVHRVLVVEQQRLIGIVTTMDIIRAVANHQLDDRTRADVESVPDD